jgi:hypothetical protein
VYLPLARKIIELLPKIYPMPSDALFLMGLFSHVKTYQVAFKELSFPPPLFIVILPLFFFCLLVHLPMGAFCPDH